MKAVGFVGTGIMGRPMARHLQAAGHRLFIVKHRSAPPQDLLAAGAVVMESPMAVAEASEVVFTMVPTPRRSTRFSSGTAGWQKG